MNTMNARELKALCYIEALENAIASSEMIMNHLVQLSEREGEVQEHILRKDRIKTILNLELSLADYCILLRKMQENKFIAYDEDVRMDINSIIHSNRFEYEEEVVVYSQRGREKVNLPQLLQYGKDVVAYAKEEEDNGNGKTY